MQLHKFMKNAQNDNKPVKNVLYICGYDVNHARLKTL